jgi:hypothetical protein
MNMSLRDWGTFVAAMVSMAAIFVAMLYLLEYKGSLKKTHAAIWKKPKRWQLVTLCVLWGFIVTAFVLLLLTWNLN